ncbi:MAG TPA: hypothetical protein VLY63_07325, partial [Anaerolineae bacterium]|nr:hypothetical protein [Anaerolineae bacterium]
PSLQKAYLGAFLLAALAYEMYAGGDYYNYWRFMAPAIPLVIVVVLHALGDALARRPVWKLSGSQRAALNRPSPGWQRAGVLAVVMLLVISANRRFLGEAMLPPSLDAGARDYVNLAVAIRAATTPDATVGVVRAGIIPYYTGRKAVDFLGKNDPYIAHLPPDLSGQINWFGMYSVSGHNKYDLEYSIKQRLPTYVEGFEWGAQNLNDWAATHYVLVKYKGMRLDLLRNSADVRWDQVQFMTRDKKNQGN